MCGELKCNMRPAQLQPNLVAVAVTTRFERVRSGLVFILKRVSLKHSISNMLAIARDQWRLLRDLYQGERTNLTGYDLINSFICWSECDENVQIYVTDANWPKHGSFLLVVSRY